MAVNNRSQKKLIIQQGTVAHCQLLRQDLYVHALTDYLYFYSLSGYPHDNSNRNCSPQRKIVFLKTHKCASSTIQVLLVQKYCNTITTTLIIYLFNLFLFFLNIFFQNLLLRRAVKTNLSVALPLTGNYLGRYRPFHRSALWGTPWEMAKEEYDLFCLHAIFDKNEVEQVMGKRSEGVK